MRLSKLDVIPAPGSGLVYDFFIKSSRNIISLFGSDKLTPGELFCLRKFAIRTKTELEASHEVCFSSSHFFFNPLQTGKKTSHEINWRKVRQRYCFLYNSFSMPLKRI